MKKSKIVKIAVIAALSLVSVAALTVAGVACGRGAASEKSGLGAAYEGTSVAPTFTKIAVDGKTDVYEMAFADGTKVQFNITNGENGENGATGKSAYEQYADAYGYDGDEKQWLCDLINGRLAGQKDVYTVSFDSAGGGRVESQAVRNGEKAAKPVDPVRENYTFEGWYSGGEEWIFCGFPVTENVTLTAKWTENYTKGLKYADLGYGYAVAGIGECTASKIVVPSEYDGLPVVGVSDGAFRNDRSVTRVRLPGSVKEIGESAFEGCSSLVAVTLSEGLEKIGVSAFKDCVGLTEIELPDNVAEIGESAFEGCSAVKNVKFGEGAIKSEKNAFNLGGVVTVSLSDVKSWCQSVFEGENSQPFAFADTLKIQDNVITTLVIPDGVKSVSDGAFKGLTTADKLILPQSLEIIGIGAFEGCSRLKSVILPDGVTTVNKNAFYGCVEMTSAVIGDKTETLGDGCFAACGNLYELTLGAAIARISPSVFAGDTALGKITVSENNPEFYSRSECVISENKGTLVLGCNESRIPEGVREIAPYAFACAERLACADFPEGLEKIGESAFEGCRNLVNVILPSTLSEIGESAFYGCEKLVEVINLSSLGIKKYSPTFGGVGYYAKHVSTERGQSRITKDENEFVFYTAAEETCLVGYEGNRTQIDLPERFDGKTYSVYDYAFYKNGELQSITFSGGVISVGEYAFYGCGALKEVVAADGIGSVGVGAFENCSNLEKVDLGKTAAICRNAFRNCENLREITFAQGLGAIGEKAFYGCGKLESVNFPGSLSDVGYAAFGECLSLQEAVFAGTEEEWNKVSLCPGWNDGVHGCFKMIFTETKI